MKIVIIGAGGVGGYFGGRLALAGNNVTFIARAEHLKAIQLNGLRVRSIKGNFIVKPANATENLKVIEKADLVLICTKAWQLKSIAKNIAPYIDKNTIVMPTQNGVLATEELAHYISPENIIGGLCKIFSKIEKPGIINHLGIEPTLIFGELNNVKSKRVIHLKNTFDLAGINNINAENFQTELWKKFLMICSSALLAVTNTTYGELRKIPETREMLKELYTEIYNVGIAHGVDLPENIAERTLIAVDSFPSNSTSSLTRDIWDSKPSEIHYQNGTVVKLGKKYNVPTPVNRFLYHSILPMEIKAGAV